MKADINTISAVSKEFGVHSMSRALRNIYIAQYSSSLSTLNPLC